VQLQQLQQLQQQEQQQQEQQEKGSQVDQRDEEQQPAPNQVDARPTNAPELLQEQLRQLVQGAREDALASPHTSHIDIQNQWPQQQQQQLLPVEDLGHIDVVYLWVNGCDPVLWQEMQQFEADRTGDNGGCGAWQVLLARVAAVFMGLARSGMILYIQQ
jgi:hypothetical protein